METGQHGPARFEDWVDRIVVDTCCDRLRRAARRPTTDVSTQTALSTPEATANVHRRLMVEQAFADSGEDDGDRLQGAFATRRMR